jgi:hypothetical protein
MHTTSDDDRVAFDTLSGGAVKELGEILAEAGYPGGIEAFAKAARRWVVDNCDSWAGLGEAEAEALTDAEALSGVDRKFPGGLDQFLEATWAFSVYRVPRAGRGAGKRPAPLVSQTGPGDNGELVVTVMQPGEG